MTAHSVLAASSRTPGRTAWALGAVLAMVAVLTGPAAAAVLPAPGLPADRSAVPTAALGASSVAFATFPGASQAVAAAVERDAAGNLLVAGYVTVAVPGGTRDQFALARFTPDGQPDPAFGTGGVVTTPVGVQAKGTGAQARDLRILPDGTIVLGGYAYWYKDKTYPDATGGDPAKTQRAFAIVGYTPTGAIASTFGAVDGAARTGMNLVSVLRNDQITALALQDGRILAAGTARAQDPPGKMFALARFDGTGLLDTGFGDEGTMTTRFGGTALNNIALDVFAGPSGEIVMAGTNNDGGGGPTASFAVARFSQSGAVQQELKTLVGIDGNPSAAYGGALLPDGRILLAGLTVDRTAQRIVTALAALRPNLFVDSDFGTAGHTTAPVGGFAQSYLESVEPDPDGGILVSGATADGSTGPTWWLLGRYLADGTPDPAFGADGFLVDEVGLPVPAGTSNAGFDGAVDLLRQPDGSSVAVGTALPPGGGPRTFALARYPTTSVTYTGATDGVPGRWTVQARLSNPLCTSGTLTFSALHGTAVTASTSAPVGAASGLPTAIAVLDVPAGTTGMSAAYAPGAAPCLGATTRTAVTTRSPYPVVPTTEPPGPAPVLTPSTTPPASTSSAPVTTPPATTPPATTPAPAPSTTSPPAPAGTVTVRSPMRNARMSSGTWFTLAATTTGALAGSPAWVALDGTIVARAAVAAGGSLSVARVPVRPGVYAVGVAATSGTATSAPFALEVVPFRIADHSVRGQRLTVTVLTGAFPAGTRIQLARDGVVVASAAVRRAGAPIGIETARVAGTYQVRARTAAGMAQGQPGGVVTIR